MVKAVLSPLSSLMLQLLYGSHTVPNSARPGATTQVWVDHSSKISAVGTFAEAKGHLPKVSHLSLALQMSCLWWRDGEPISRAAHKPNFVQANFLQSHSSDIWSSLLSFDELYQQTATSVLVMRWFEGRESAMTAAVEHAPGDEDGGVVVRVVAVVQDVLALLPDAKVLQSGLGVEGNDRTVLRDASRERERG